MGKISQKHRWVAALASCLLAVALNIGLTIFGTQYSTTYCDGHVISRGPNGDAIIPFGMDIADTFCAHFGSGPPPDPHRALAAFATVSGLFAREPVQPRLALFGGVIGPLLLILFGVYIALPSKRPLTRIVAIVSFLPGIMCGLVFIFFLRDDRMILAHPVGWANVRDALLSLVALVPAMLFIAGGTFLWRKSFLPKS